MAVSIKWFPPSWFQIKTKDKVIYIDPAYLKSYFTNHPSKIEFSSWPDEIDGLPEKGMKKADIILITHHHKDHCKNVTTNRLKTSKTIVFAPKNCLNELGENIELVKPGDIFNLDGIKITVVEAYNTPEGHSTKKFHKKGVCVGYLVNIQNITIYHAGDSDFIPEMKDLGYVDVALVPIGGTFTMNIEEAVKATLEIRPRFVIPIHMRDKDPLEFKKLVENNSKIKVKILKNGEKIILN